MTDRRLTDAQISAALRAHLPTHAPIPLTGQIADATGDTHQRRPWPRVVGVLAEVGSDPSRRMLLVAAVALLALLLASSAFIGASRLLDRRPLPLVQVDAPVDARALAASAYDRMTDLPPMTVTALTDGTRLHRIYVDSAGAVRIEEAMSPDAAADTYRILTGTTKGELTRLGSEAVWVVQEQAISEDPRVFVYAELQGTAMAVEPGCGSATDVGNGWTYVGVEKVLDRPAYHITCGAGDLWLDTETRLILRSRGGAVDGTGRAVPGSSTTLEVTELAFGEPPARLFDLATPPGATGLTSEAYTCRVDPASCATPEPAWTPPPDAILGPLASVAPSRISNGWIAYATGGPMPGSTDTTTGTDLYLVREGVEPRLIAGRDNGITRNVCPAFSADGTKLAYGVANTATGRSVVVVSVDADGTIHDANPMIVAGGGPPVCPHWADDNTIAYVDDSVVVVRGIDGLRLAPTDRDPTVADLQPAAESRDRDPLAHRRVARADA